MQFSSNLKHYRKQAELSQSELAQKVESIVGEKVSYENVKSWEKGTNPKIIMIYGLAEALNIPEQLLFDNTEKTIHKIVKEANISSNQLIEENDLNNMPILHNDVELIEVKVYSDIYASAGLGNATIEDTNEQVTVFDKNFLKDFFGVQNYGSVDMIRVVGDSMEPLIHDGEYIFIERETKPKNGDTIIAIINNELFVKNYKLLDPFNGTCRLVSNNSSYPDINIDTPEKIEALTILGIVRCRMKMF